MDGVARRWQHHYIVEADAEREFVSMEWMPGFRKAKSIFLSAAIMQGNFASAAPKKFLRPLCIGFWYYGVQEFGLPYLKGNRMRHVVIYMWKNN